PRDSTFTSEDDGAGVPEEQREEIMSPFTRLDTARNQDVGGSVGLGLAIAKDVARSHGGALELSDSAELGGLKAVLRLPC
ncbi:MAG: two-component sensor histidine kinase, partial [Rhodobacteraceae bacterium]|nr:two-component sensor histidine kinase [Paracoccaceae bacterium]